MNTLVNDTDEMRANAAREDMEADALAAAEYVITGFGASGAAIEPIIYGSDEAGAARRDARHFRDEGWNVRLRRFWR